MKYCMKCSIKVASVEDKCPLCFSELTVVEAADGAEGQAEMIAKYPPLEGIGVKRYSFRLRLALFLSILGGSTCLLINLMVYRGSLWSLIIIGAILFWWFAIVRPHYTKKKFGYRVVIQIIFIPVLLYIIERVTFTKGWALDFATPFLFIGGTVYITVVICVKGMKWRDYSSYQIIMGLLCFVPLMLCFLGALETVWPSVVSAFYSLMTFVGMRIFADRKFENEVIKRFHV